MEVIGKIGAIVYPSSAEGTSTAVVQAVRAGLVPIISPETGLDPQVGGIVLRDPTVESVRKAVKIFSETPAADIEKMARIAWKYVSEHHTKKEFTSAYSRFIDTILKI